jgi:hypothetical protein
LLLPVGPDRHSPSTKQKKAEPLLLSLLSEKWEGRFLLLQCHTPPQSFCSTLFALFIKGPLKEGWELFGFCLLWLYFGLLDFLLFALGGILPLNNWEEAFTLGLLV